MADTANHGQIRALTGIRGIAATAVVLYHLDLGQRNAGILQHILHHAYLAVDLFFVLSGFVMALTYSSMFLAGGGAGSYWKFLNHRIARIYPLYLVICILCFISNSVEHGAPDVSLPLFGEIAANLAMVQAWGVAESINGDAWSISTEWLAYLIFPALIWLTLRRGNRQAVIAGILCIGLLAALAFAPDFVLWRDPQVRQGPLDRADPFSLAPMLRCLCEFILGLLTYRVAASAKMLKAAQSLSLPIFLALLVLLAIPGADLSIVLLMPALVLALSTDRGPLARAIGGPVTLMLGNFSYAIYLLHPLIIWPGAAILDHRLAAAGLAHAAAMTVVAVLFLTIGFAALAYYFIERPARRALRRMRRAAPALAASGGPDLARRA